VVRGPWSVVRHDLTASRFTVTTVPLTALGQREDGSPRPAGPRAPSQHALNAARSTGPRQIAVFVLPRRTPLARTVPLLVLTREVAPQLSGLSPAHLDPRVTRPPGIPPRPPRIRTGDSRAVRSLRHESASPVGQGHQPLHVMQIGRMMQILRGENMLHVRLRQNSGSAGPLQTGPALPDTTNILLLSSVRSEVTRGG